MIRFAILFSLVFLSPAQAGPVSFSDWKTHWFALFSKVSFDGSPRKMSVTADDAVSITYKILPESEWGATRARWSWAVDKTVPPTDLTQKGGDDRNLALYFAFLPKSEAAAARGASIRKLLKNPNGRVLVYVFGGQHKRGAILPSTYLGARGKTVVLRGSGIGSFVENVDLAADYKQAFGKSVGALVALALSADSDDTGAIVAGQIGALALE